MEGVQSGLDGATWHLRGPRQIASSQQSVGVEPSLRSDGKATEPPTGPVNELLTCRTRRGEGGSIAAAKWFALKAAARRPEPVAAAPPEIMPRKQRSARGDVRRRFETCRHIRLDGAAREAKEG